MPARSPLSTMALVLALAGLACSTLRGAPETRSPALATLLPPTRTPVASASPVATATQPRPRATAGPATPTAAMQAGAEGIGDPYFPDMGNGGYDVLHYTLDLTVDVQRNHVDGTATLVVQPRNDLSRFNLDFVGLQVGEVLVNGQPAAYEREAGELIISAPQPLSAAEEFTVAVRYSGTPGESVPPGAADYEIGWNRYDEGILVAGEPTGAASWYPVNDHPLDKAPYTFRITVAEPYDVAANGVLQETLDNGATRTFLWEARDPLASYLVTLAIADFDVQTATTPGGVPIRNYFAEGLSQSVVENFDRLPEMVDRFAALFGPYPFEVYGVVVHDTRLGFALETQTLSTFGRSFANESVVAHELAHEWFGNSVSLEGWQHIWLNEGFASYAETLWTEHVDGQAAAEQEIRALYAALANPAEAEFGLSRAEMASLVRRLPLEDVTLTREEARHGLSILLDNALTDAEIENLVSSISTAGLPGRDLADLVSGAPFEQVTITRQDFYDFLRAVHLGALADELSQPLLIGDPKADNLFDRQIYDRGALTLHALRLEVGDQAFFDILRAYAERYFHANAGTDEFIAVAEEVSGQDLDAFIEAWLFEPDLPDIPQMNLHRSDFSS